MSERFTVGVVGAGRMGTGIAHALAASGFPVLLGDQDAERARAGRARIGAALSEEVARGRMTAGEAEATLERIAPVGGPEDLAPARLVVEAVPEEPLEKKGLLRALDRILTAEAVLATNTSSLYVTELASVTERPGQVIGLHYFHPLPRNPLVEVVPGALTRGDVVEWAVAFARAHGRTPIRASDSPGFAINRFLLPLAAEAVRLVEEGVADVPTVDAAAAEALGAPAGPFAVMNASGLDVTLSAASNLGVELGPFYEPPDLLRERAASGRPWELGGEADRDLFPEVARRLLAVVFAVSAQVVEEGVASEEEVDLGARVGLRWALGPFERMREVGPARVLAWVEALAERHPALEIPERLRREAR